MSNTSSLATAKANAVANDVFSKDLGFSWRAISVPLANIRIRLRQDLAEHKFSEKDGAEMEPTGRAPIEFTARIPFLNGAIPGSNEAWDPGTLYPGVLQKFLVAMFTKTKDVLSIRSLEALLAFLTSLTLNGQLLLVTAYGRQPRGLRRSAIQTTSTRSSPVLIQSRKPLPLLSFWIL